MGCLRKKKKTVSRDMSIKSCMHTHFPAKLHECDDSQILYFGIHRCCDETSGTFVKVLVTSKENTQISLYIGVWYEMSDSFGGHRQS